MDEKKDLRIIRLIYAGLFILTGLLSFGVSVLTDKSYEMVLRNTIVSLIISGTNLFMLSDAYSRGKEAFLYDNYYHGRRFALVYLVMIVLSCSFSLVPNQLWPYMSLFVILSLLSNAEIGMISGIGFVIISVLLESGGNIAELFMYVIAGCVAIAVFRDLKENTNVRIPIAISLMMQAVLLMAFNILFQNRTLSFVLFILPVINLMINLVILLIFLNVFGLYVIRKTNDRYMEVNDSEFSLLVRLKEEKKEEYFRAIHTAYLAERIAIGLGLNLRAVKNCSYYHRIGMLENKTTWEEVKHFYEDNSFPIEAIPFLKEYIDPQKGAVRTTESLAVNVSESLISSLMELFKYNKELKLDYDKMIDNILDKKIETGELLNYDVSYRQYDQIRKILKKEKLYYDFLR